MASTSKETPKETPKAVVKEEEEQKYEVVLFLYDISQGMAKALSMGLVGKQLDGIWHTGLIVYGYEYYYGGGIQAALPGQTMAGKPVQTYKLGYTSLPQDLFHEYLQSISNRFTAATYSLLKWNCNNFTSECSKFLTGNDIPSHITGLPEEALNTPMGQMFKPFIVQMEQQMKGSVVPWQENDGGGGGGGNDLSLPLIRPATYYAKLPRDFSYANMVNVTPAAGGGGGGGESKTNASLSDMAAMLGFNMPTPGSAGAQSSTKTPAATATTPSSSSSSSKNEQKSDGHAHNSLKLTVIPTQNKVLLSEDKKHKSFQVLIKGASKKLDKEMGLSKEDTVTLDAVSAVMDTPNSPMPGDAFALFERLVRDWPVSSLFSVLGLFRLFVLRPDVSAAYEEQFREVNKTLSDCLPSFARILTLLNQAQTGDAASQIPNNAKLMAYCALSNLFARPSFAKLLASDSEIIKAAKSAIASSDETLAVMGSNVLFNCCVYLPKDDSDVSIETVSYLAETLKTIKSPAIGVRLLISLGQLVYKNSGNALLLTTAYEFDVRAIQKALAGVAGASADTISQLNSISDDVSVILQHEAAAAV